VRPPAEQPSVTPGNESASGSLGEWDASARARSRRGDSPAVRRRTATCRSAIAWG